MSHARRMALPERRVSGPAPSWTEFDRTETRHRRRSKLAVSALSGVLLLGCARDHEPRLDPVPAAASEARPGQYLVYQVGNARILALLDARRPTPASVFQASPELVADLLRVGGEATRGAQGEIARSSAIWAFLVEMDNRRVLVDAGGADIISDAGGLVPALAAAGVQPHSIDDIVISHLHVDHIGALLDDAGDARFGNAILHLDDTEATYWTNPANAARASINEQRTFPAVRRVVDAYGARVRRFSGQSELVPGLTSEPLAGHTPGHNLYRLSPADVS